MRPGHIHNHLRLCLGSHRIYELIGMLGMQLKLLYPRRSRFAPKSPASSGETLNSNIEIRNNRKGYVKERLYPKVKQFRAFCQLYSATIRGFRRKAVATGLILLKSKYPPCLFFCFESTSPHDGMVFCAPVSDSVTHIGNPGKAVVN